MLKVGNKTDLKGTLRNEMDNSTPCDDVTNFSMCLSTSTQTHTGPDYCLLTELFSNPLYQIRYLAAIWRK